MELHNQATAFSEFVAVIVRSILSVSVVQDVMIGAAIGGRDAGTKFEGDRRFPIIVRLNDEVRENLEALKNLPVPLPPSAQTGRAPAVTGCPI